MMPDTLCVELLCPEERDTKERRAKVVRALMRSFGVEMESLELCTTAPSDVPGRYQEERSMTFVRWEKTAHAPTVEHLLGLTAVATGACKDGLGQIVQGSKSGPACVWIVELGEEDGEDCIVYPPDMAEEVEAVIEKWNEPGPTR
jgi:hypothetical protein